MGGRSRFERLGSTSTSSGEGGEDFPMTTTFIKQHQSQTLIPSNNSTASSSSPAKKSAGRRSVKKRVVSVPIVEIDGSRPKGGGEGAPPSDSWTWRKYGQKPIKGSPYPRGYYRCSSSKGCPARKQVERSRLDPTMLIVTYAAEHNHAWPLPKNRNHHNHNYQSEPPPLLPPVTAQLPASQDTEEEVEVEEELNGSLPQSPNPAATTTTTNTSTCSVDDTNNTPTFAPDLGQDDSPLMMIEEDLGWRPYMSATSLQSDVAMMMPVSYDDVRKDLSIGDGGGGDEDEDGSLFAGLGELPECSVVFRRGFPVGAV